MPTRVLRRWRAIAALIGATFLLAGCHPSSPPPALTSKEKAFMNTYTTHMVTHCFGRYLIDLPADMQVGKMASAMLAISPYFDSNSAIEVKVTPMTQTTFEHALEERKAKLEAERVVGHQEWAVLKDIISLPDQEGLIFNRTDGGMSRALRLLELHGWKHGYAIKMTVKTFDETFPEDQQDPDLKAMGTDTPQKLAILQALYARTAGRPSGEIPTQPGTCIQNGFISGPASDKMSESISIDFVSKSMPDVNFTLQSNSGIRGTTTLLERLPDIEASLKAAKGHFIRKGHHTNPKGMSYDEILMAAITPNDHVMGQYFTLEANSKKGSAETPLLNIDFFNGDREDPSAPAEDDLVRIPPPKLPPLSKASLSEAEAVDLWDKTTATLRPRPGAF